MMTKKAPYLPKIYWTTRKNNLIRLQNKKSLSIVGLMTGTSMDGLDGALVQISRSSSTETNSKTRGRTKTLAPKHFSIRLRLLDRFHSSFPAKMRAKLQKAVEQDLKVDELSFLHYELGLFYKKKLEKICKLHKWKMDLIGMHGQTVHHAPPHATLQIGEPSYMAEHFKLPVVTQFRSGDLVLGGQAAPLSPFFHYYGFAPKVKEDIFCVQNLGGIGNVSYIDKSRPPSKALLQAFDTGPANMLLDSYVHYLSKGKKSYDQGGEWAAKGLPCLSLVDSLLSHSYFKIKPPKSCGREEFGFKFLSKHLRALKRCSPQDALATLVEGVALSIAQSYQQFLPKFPSLVLLCGGGAKNVYLRHRLQQHLYPAKVTTTQDFHWPVESIEPAAFALLAAFRVWNQPVNIAQITGASRTALLGQIIEV